MIIATAFIQEKPGERLEKTSHEDDFKEFDDKLVFKSDDLPTNIAKAKIAGVLWPQEYGAIIQLDSSGTVTEGTVYKEIPKMGTAQIKKFEGGDNDVVELMTRVIGEKPVTNI